MRKIAVTPTRLAALADLPLFRGRYTAFVSRLSLTSMICTGFA
jgi:hypothetical protein